MRNRSLLALVLLAAACALEPGVPLDDASSGDALAPTTCPTPAAGNTVLCSGSGPTYSPYRLWRTSTRSSELAQTLTATDAGVPRRLWLTVRVSTTGASTQAIVAELRHAPGGIIESSTFARGTLPLASLPRGRALEIPIDLAPLDPEAPVAFEAGGQYALVLSLDSAAEQLSVVVAAQFEDSYPDGTASRRVNAGDFRAASGDLSFALVLGAPLDAGGFSYAGELRTRRAQHTATALADGTVLFTGGSATPTPTATWELFDPATSSTTAMGAFSPGRYEHTASLLPDGRVLVIGGGATYSGSAPLASTTIFNPSTHHFTPGPSLAVARFSHVVTTLDDGRILVTGGNLGQTTTDTAELYDPATGHFSTVGPMNVPRQLHAAVRLADGRVLVAGGGGLIEASAEVFDPATNTFTPTGPMTEPRAVFTMTLLDSGEVLVVGGFNGNGVAALLELYNPATGTFTLLPTAFDGRYYHSTSKLADGRVLIAGGFTVDRQIAPTLVFTPGDASLEPSAGDFLTPRAVHTATPLADGRLLFAGGLLGGDAAYLARLEYFTP